LFILLLIVSFGILLAVESLPSETVGYVKYDCLVGLDLVAMPMDDGLTTTEGVGTLINASAFNIDALNLWDATSQSWMSTLWLDDSYWDNPMPVEPGSVLMINSVATHTYYSIGDLPAADATYDFIVGLNMAMVPLNRSDLTTTELVGLEIVETDAINLWDAASQSWMSTLWLDDSYWDNPMPVAIGTPMFLNYTGTGETWPAGRNQSTISTSKKVK